MDLAGGELVDMARRSATVGELGLGVEGDVGRRSRQGRNIGRASSIQTKKSQEPNATTTRSVPSQAGVKETGVPTV